MTSADNTTPTRPAFTLWRWLMALVWLVILLVWWWPQAPVSHQANSAGTDAQGRALHWYKGNTHAHAGIQLGDYRHGNASREQVARWYHDHGYHFLAITDHNKHFDAALESPTLSRDDFLLLSGMEITSDHRYPGVMDTGERKIHGTALNTEDAIDWGFEDSEVAAIIRRQAQQTADNGGVYVLNHPNYRFQVTADDIMRSESVALMELFNDHPRANQDGHAGFRPALETLWNQLLDSGTQVYGVAADDAHDFGRLRAGARRFGTAPPGGAWIMVRAAALTASDISNALQNGDFYASTGVILSEVSTTDGVYTVAADRAGTKANSRLSWVSGSAPVVWSDDSHLVIEFIGAHGRVLHTVHDQTRAQWPLDANEPWVRAKVTYLDKSWQWVDRNRARAYYAWTQPLMRKQWNNEAENTREVQ